MRRATKSWALILVGLWMVPFGQPVIAGEVALSEGSLSPDRAYLGFSMGLEDLEDGVRAIRVVRPVVGSPAERAGLQDGDLVVAINDQPITVSDLFALLRDMDGFKAGETLRLQVRRGEESLVFEVRTSRYTPSDFQRLNDWLMVMEGRRKDSLQGSKTPPGTSCPAAGPTGDDSNRRWGMFLVGSVRAVGSATLTVKREASSNDLVFEVSPASIRLPPGFSVEDLPSSMRQTVSRLRPGDAIAYELESEGPDFHVRPLGELPPSKR